MLGTEYRGERKVHRVEGIILVLPITLGGLPRTDLYEFNIERGGLPLRRRVLAGLVVALCISALWFVVHLVWWASRQPRMELFWESAFFGIGMSAVLTFSSGFGRGIVARCTLQVDSDSVTELIEMGEPGRTMRRSVRRGRVRSIFVKRGLFGRPGRIGVSEKSGFGAWLSGYVYVPDTLEKFWEIKLLVESWREPETSG